MLAEFGSALYGACVFPTARVRQHRIVESLDTLVDERVQFFWFYDVVSIGRTAQNGEADVTHVHIHAVFSVIEQTETVSNVSLPRGSRHDEPEEGRRTRSCTLLTA